MPDIVTIILMASSVNFIITVIRWVFESKEDKYLQYREKCFEKHKCTVKEKKEDGMLEKQTVYKIDGDFNGNIDGDNVTVILMNGDMNGNIKSKDGNVVVIKGDINGNVEANKVICPNQDKTAMQKYIDKLTCIEKLSKNPKCNKEEEEKDCFKCYWFDSEKELCKSWDANEGKCEFVDKDRVIKEAKEVLDWVLPKPTEKNKYVCCADCGYATEHIRTVSGFNNAQYYSCERFKKIVSGDYCICDKFIRKSCDTCHYSLNKDADGYFECYKKGHCEYVPREEEQSKKCCANCNHYQNDSYKILTNGSVLKTYNCYTCALGNIPFENEDPNKMCCAYYVRRNPAKDVDSPELPVKTSLKEELKRIIAETPKPATTIYK